MIDNFDRGRGWSGIWPIFAFVFCFTPGEYLAGCTRLFFRIHLEIIITSSDAQNECRLANNAGLVLTANSIWSLETPDRPWYGLHEARPELGGAWTDPERFI